MSNKQQIIKDTIQWKYNKQNQALRFGSQPMYWADVIMARDWSMLKQLKRCEVNDSNIDILLKINWPQLLDLSLSLNKLTAIGAKHLACKEWPKLHSLNLYSNDIKDEGMIEIIKSMQNKLLSITLYRCGITVRGIKELIQFRMINLKFLLLSGNKIGNLGMKWFVKTDLPNLQDLRIYECNIEGEGFRHMTKAIWPNLGQLWLGFDFQQDNRMNLTSWKTLYENPWKQIKKIAVRQVQPICLINCVLLQGNALQMFRYYLRIKNQQMTFLIKQILINRKLI